MRRKLFYTLTCLTFSFAAFSQNRPKNYTEQIIISDFNGRPFEKYSPEIQGSPFFIDEFRLATLIFNGRRNIDTLKVRIDLYKQEIDLKITEEIELIAGTGTVREVWLKDDLNPKIVTVKFRSGLPAIDNQTENNFYQVLSDGKIVFVKSIRKKLTEFKNEVSGDVSKEFETLEDHYVMVNSAMQKVKRNNQFFVDLMQDKKAEVEKFISDKKINCKDLAKAAVLVDYYNSLYK
jgi:hypothetical protein